MRIVAGLAKGRRLAVADAGTRPTSDRAREALFNSLGAQLDLDGARVLDLYAGTGAVGLEALSRGASTAVFVDSGHKQVEVLRRNVATVGLPGALVRRRAVSVYLGDGPLDGPFDVVFTDPPYALTDAELAPVLDAVTGQGWLVPGAVLVVERSAHGGAPPWPDSVESGRDRRYGSGVLWYGRRR